MRQEKHSIITHITVFIVVVKDSTQANLNETKLNLAKASLILK